jgi:predicted ribosome quality control (RQC) complex YloA/Tae2 family protein
VLAPAGARSDARPEGARPEAKRILRLRFSADPEASRLHVQHDRVERHEGPLGPFYRAVESDLAGGTVAGLAPVRSDRIAILEVRDGAAGERRALVLELFGRRANLILLGPDDRVVAVLVEPPGSGQPRIEVGAAWHPPLGKPGEPGPSIAEAFGVVESEELAPLSRVVERALGSRAQDVRRERDARDLAERLERKLERARGLVRGLKARFAAGSEAERVRADGELLKTQLGRIARGTKSVAVADPSQDGAERKIVLDPKLSPVQNLERMFERARKLESDASSAAADLEGARAREGALAALAAEARSADVDPADVEARALASGLLEARQSALPPKRRAEPAPRLPYKSFATARGGEIRVGRSARDNDDLTFHHAKGSDLWLHTADTPGSHVVLVLEKGADPDSEDLVDAAHLAVHFSPLRGATRGRVHVARRKEVHKPRGAKPGLVQLSGGRILDVRMQPDRLRRLLGGRGPAPE